MTKLLGNRYFFALAFFLFITSIIIFSWFRFGHMYGGGDVGLPTYDPKRILEITRYIWWEAAAPGFLVSNSVVSTPLAFFLSILQLLGFSSVVIQATLFFVLLFLMGFGMYLVGLDLFGKERKCYAILAGLFYMFNPYMMIQIWHRFIHNTFFLAAAFPFFFLLFSYWIKTGRYIYLSLFLLVNLIAVYLYGAIAFIVTVFVLLVFIYTVEILFPWKGFLNLKLVSTRAFVGILFWLAIHSWWILPTFGTAPAVLSAQHSVRESLSVLLTMSSQTIIPYSLLGINPYYLYTQADFGDIFDNYFFRSLPWILLIFLIPGFFVALKNKKWASWALFAIAGIFLSKGATSPFGYPYIFGFSNFFSLGVLRNPFEKLGILMPFSYAILFSLGVSFFWSKFNLKYKWIMRFFILAAVVFYLGVFVWPMWLGKIFGRIDKPAFVDVPESYKQVDEYISKQNKKGRILHLPLTNSEAATYYWQYGYSGVEPSQLLFKTLPSISHGFNQGTIDDALSGLSGIFMLPDSEDKILTFLQSFSIGFLVLHKDIEWRGGYLSQPQELESRLSLLSFLERKDQFGDLTIYELKDEFFSPKIKLANNFDFFVPSESNNYWPWLLSSDNSELLSPLKNNTTELLVKKGSALIVLPERVYEYEPQEIAKENLLGEITAAKVLPDSLSYLLIRIKERFQYAFLPAADKFTFKLILMGKRLTESYLLKEKGSLISVIPQLREYQRLLPEIKDGVEARSRGKEGEKEISIQFTLSRHLAALNFIKEKAGIEEKEVVEDVINSLINFMENTSIIPYNQIADEETSDVSLISRFNIFVAGKYELLQAHDQIQNIYPNNLETNRFQINKELVDLKGVFKNNFISYGTFDLPQGINEISFVSVPSVNLARFSEFPTTSDVKESNGEVRVTSYEHEPSYFDIELEPEKGGTGYQLTFESWIILGDKFKVQVLQDTDRYELNSTEVKIPSYDNSYLRSPYENYWNSDLLQFEIRPTTTKTKIRFLVESFDGCKYLHMDKSNCLKKDVKFKDEKSSQVVFKNIKIIKLLNNPLFLRAELPNKNNKPAGEISFIQNNAVSYSGKINLNEPGFFIFNESFHLGWLLELYSKGRKIVPSQKFLSNLYGNAWYIEEAGEYNFNLEFLPNNAVKKGIIISMVCLLFVMVLTVRQRLRK